jgi:hypothetical protein
VYSEIGDITRTGDPQAYFNSNYVCATHNSYESLDQGQYNNHAYDSIGEEYDVINDDAITEATNEHSAGLPSPTSLTSDSNTDEATYVGRPTESTDNDDSSRNNTEGVSSPTLAPPSGTMDERRHSYLEVLPSGEIVDDTHIHSYIDLVADELVTETPAADSNATAPSGSTTSANSANNNTYM